ncbi:class I adenylate-forming enzyme family protein [Sporosarcina sp. 179-K 8C2 HS]|uniref:class I adenylate-forming enzyme family protein n=1 Tax=Sporosarcina sp. 179-K 8C2 HS TaxID=3142387 RepID=UPI0039A3BA67
MGTIYNWIFNQDLVLNKTIISTQHEDYTYNDIQNEIEKYTKLLQPLGELKNKKVALIVPSVPSFISLVLTVNKLGGIFIPVSPLLRKDDLVKVLDFSDPHIIFTTKNHNGFSLEESVHSWAESSKLETIIFDSEDHKVWEQVHYKGEKRPLELEEMQMLACTSGSTGTPKGIVADLEYVKAASNSFVVMGELNKYDDVFLMAPASGNFGVCWLLSSLHAQYHLITTESFSFPDIIQILEKKPCQKLVSTPSLVRALYLFATSSSSPVFEKLSLIFLAGEMISEDFLHALSNVKGKMRSCYGISEYGGMMYTVNDIREGINWTVLPNVEYKLDKQSQESIGELAFKGENEFLGYYKRPDLTEEVYKAGWYNSGDLAKINEDGTIEIIGRQKDMIKKGGQQVIPGEIEQFFGKHPSVQKAVVVGIPDSVYGERIVAFVSKETEIDVKELYEYCHNQIARYKVPDEIRFIEEIPIINGKTDKVALKQLAMQSN